VSLRHTAMLTSLSYFVHNNKRVKWNMGKVEFWW